MKSFRKPKTNEEVYLELVEEALKSKKRYVFQVYCPPVYVDIRTVLATKDECGRNIEEKDIALMKYLKNHPAIFKKLSKNNMKCEISYNKESDNYKISLLEEFESLQKKVEQIEVETYYEDSVTGALDVLEIHLADQAKIEQENKGYSRKRKLGK